MTPSRDTAAFAPPEAPLPMPVQVLESPGRPGSSLWRTLAPLLRRTAD